MTVPALSNVPLAPLTTFRIGGPAARLVRVTSVPEIVDALRSADASKEPVFVLGGGSNVVVSDAGFPGLVVQIDSRGIDVVREGERVLVTVAAGESWDAFVLRAIEDGWSGVECMSGIPGKVGATPMQNVGAYGQEVGDTIVKVSALDRTTGAIITFDRESCRFAYRSSFFKGIDRYVVTEVTFALATSTLSSRIRYGELAKALGVSGEDDPRAPSSIVRETVIELRRGKGMVIDPNDPESVSAGSFFVNPIVSASDLVGIEARLTSGMAMPRFPADGGQTKLAAGWLIENAGFVKGTTRGNVGVSRKHALALVNRGGATARELLEFARTIEDGVFARFGVRLAREPVLVGMASLRD